MIEILNMEENTDQEYDEAYQKGLTDAFDAILTLMYGIGTKDIKGMFGGDTNLEKILKLPPRKVVNAVNGWKS